jgi:hypothetical protein
MFFGARIIVFRHCGPVPVRQATQSSTRMRILLQNVRNKLFFRGDDAWTADPDVALDFQRSQDLYDFVTDHRLEDVQLVVKFSSPLQFEVVPIESSTTRYDRS